MELKQENASRLKKLLYETIDSAPKVNCVEWVYPDKYGYSNTLAFNIGVDLYAIDWYWNESKLNFKNGMFCFDSVKVSGTWPNGYKNNLQFSLNGRVVGVIPLEKY